MVVLLGAGRGGDSVVALLGWSWGGVTLWWHCWDGTGR